MRIKIMCVYVCARTCVCVCVCVCARSGARCSSVVWRPVMVRWLVESIPYGQGRRQADLTDLF